MIIGATFLTLLDKSIGAAGTFWLYTALNIAFVGITSGSFRNQNVTLEHIERKLMAGEKLRNIGV